MAKAAASARSNTAAAHDRPRSKVGMAVSPTPKCRRGLLARSVAGKDHAAQFRKPSLNLCIGEGRVDFPVELIDHLSGRVLVRTKPINRTRFVAWHKFSHGRDVRQGRNSQVADNCVVELVGLEPATRVLWNAVVSDQLTLSNTRYLVACFNQIERV